MAVAVQERIFSGRILQYESQSQRFYCREMILRYLLREAANQGGITDTNKMLSIKVSDDYSIQYSDRSYNSNITRYTINTARAREEHKEFMDYRAYSKAMYATTYVVPYLKELYGDRIRIIRKVVMHPRFMPRGARKYATLPSGYTYTNEFKSKSYVPIEAALTFVTLCRLFEPNFKFINNNISIDAMVTKYASMYQEPLFLSQELRDMLLFYFYIKTRKYTVNIMPDFIEPLVSYFTTNDNRTIPGGGYLGTYVEELYQRSLIKEPFYKSHTQWLDYNTSISIVNTAIAEVVGKTVG